MSSHGPSYIRLSTAGEPLTRREFAGRATVLAGAIGAASLFGEPPAALAQAPAALGAERSATFRALVETVAPQVPGRDALVERVIARFGKVFGGSDDAYRQAAERVLEVVQESAPGEGFSRLSIEARRAFVAAQTQERVELLDFGSTSRFHSAIDRQAEQTRQAALLSPRGIAQLAAPPGEDGPLVLIPDPLTGYVPDFDQDFPDSEEPPPPPTPSLPPPLTEGQVRTLTVRSGIDLALLAFETTPESAEDDGEESE